MRENERDTHFAGFAKLLWDEFEDLGHRLPPDFNFTPENWAWEVQQLVARRVYDLVMHTLFHSIDSFDPNYDYELLEGIPDLTTWPEHS